MISSTVGRPRTTKLHAAEAGPGQIFISAAPSERYDAYQAAELIYGCVGDVLRETGAEIVHERLFGSLTAELAVMAARHEALSAGNIPPDGPVTYVQGHPPWGEGLAGVLVRAVSTVAGDDGIWTIEDAGVPCGHSWCRNGNRFVVLQNLQGLASGDATVNSPAAQARRVIERADLLLKKHGATFRDVIRTWFYLSAILGWYGTFNSTRNAKYGAFGLVPLSDSEPLLLPASTGIQGDTPQGGACALDLLATLGAKDSKPLIKQMSNQLQEDAFRYGAAFSRGALIRESDVSLIQVSGTAAIDEAGASLYPGDIRAQIHCTMDRIEGLVDQEGGTLKDICAATAFVKRAKDAAVFQKIAADRGLAEFPGICVVADICRDELLFELDAELALDRSAVFSSVASEMTRMGHTVRSALAEQPFGGHVCYTERQSYLEQESTL